MGDSVPEIGEIVLQRSDGREAVERRDRKIGVAQPAEAIVPVALGIGVLGNARREGRDDAAGFLIDAEFQRDGGANDGVLPVWRGGEAA